MLIRKLCRRRWRWQIGKSNPVNRFPVVSRHHLNRIPGTPIKKRAVRSFANAFLAADAEIWINFDAAEWRMILVRNPEHTRFNRAILDARRRTSATSAAISSDGKYARLLLTRCLAVAFRHGPMFFDDVVHRVVVRIQKSGFRSRNKTNGSQNLEPSSNFCF